MTCIPKYSDWAQWFWRGAVHIDDVASAVMLGVDLHFPATARTAPGTTLDSAYEYTDADLDQWDADGAGSTFRKHYPEYYDLALSYGLDPAAEAIPGWIFPRRFAGWVTKPSYSLANLLAELAAYGDAGPPRSHELRDHA